MESTSLRQVRGWELDHVKNEVGEVKSKQNEHSTKLASHDEKFASLLASIRLSVGIAVIVIPMLTALFAWLVLEVSTVKVTIEQMGEKK